MTKMWVLRLRQRRSTDLKDEGNTVGWYTRTTGVRCFKGKLEGDGPRVAVGGVGLDGRLLLWAAVVVVRLFRLDLLHHGAERAWQRRRGGGEGQSQVIHDPDDSKLWGKHYDLTASGKFRRTNKRQCNPGSMEKSINLELTFDRCLCACVCACVYDEWWSVLSTLPLFLSRLKVGIWTGVRAWTGVGGTRRGRLLRRTKEETKSGMTALLGLQDSGLKLNFSLLSSLMYTNFEKVFHCV